MSPRASGNPGGSTFTVILGMCWRESVNPSQTGAMARSRVWLPSVLMPSPLFCRWPAPDFLCPGRCVDRDECGEARPPYRVPPAAVGAPTLIRTGTGYAITNEQVMGRFGERLGAFARVGAIAWR